MSDTIRLARGEDAAGCLAIYLPFVEHTAVSFETELPTVATLRGRMEQTLQRMPWLVCERDGAVLGYAYAGGFRSRPAYQWTAETTVYVAEHAREAGVGRRLYGNLLACLRTQGFVNAVALITLPNPASVALHEALGFKPVGVLPHVGYKLARWHDVGEWYLPLAPQPAQPVPPLALPEVAARLRWA